MIRLNLLAEAHAEQEQRRKDPVKRAVWAGVLAVMLILAWSSSLQLRSLVVKGEVNKLEAVLKSKTNDYSFAVANIKKVAEAKHKLAALRQLATNRFLQAPVLNALQQATVDDVQLTRFRTEQAYVLTEASKPTTNANRVVSGKPARVTEKITISLDAKDTAANPGDQVHKFKQAIASHPLFEELLGLTNEVRLANLSAPQTVPPGRPFVSFSLECRLPEKSR